LRPKRLSIAVGATGPTSHNAAFVECQKYLVVFSLDHQNAGLSLLSNQLKDFCDPEIPQVSM
jgi:hypothetical protein